MNNKKAQKAEESTALKRFLALWPNCPEKYTIEIPKSDFPDFILATPKGDVTIELTRAVTSERWKEQVKYLEKIEEFITKKCEESGITIRYFYLDDPKTKWYDLWERRNDTWNWILSSINADAAADYEEIKFGTCLGRFWRSQGSAWFDFGWTNRIYSGFRPEKEVALHIKDIIVKKLRKYLPYNKKADLLLIISEHAEPVIRDHISELEHELINLCNQSFAGDQTIKSVSKRVFNEICVLIGKKLIWLNGLPI